jgi:hypothetical protein
MLPNLDSEAPGPHEIAIDLAHHIVYATTTGISYELLSGRR